MAKAISTSFERLLQRQRAVHAGGIGALQHQPFGAGLEPGLGEQQLQRHARIHDVMDHAVGELAAVELRAAPLHAGIGGAFEKIDVILARHPLDVFHREDQRLVDEAMDHEPVIGRVDLGDAAVMALEAQAGRRDDAVELMQRREIHRGFRRGREPGDVAADDVLLEGRRRAIGALVDAVAEIAVPVLNLGDQRIGLGRRARSGGAEAASPAPASPAAPRKRRRSSGSGGFGSELMADVPWLWCPGSAGFALRRR
jgi:hypothetical protein